MGMKICVVTTNRADYGLLRPVLHALSASAQFNLRLVVTGSHLLTSAGRTIDEIRKDNLAISREILIFPNSMRSDQHAVYVAEGIKKFDLYFKESKPDAVMVLGDRFELFSVVLPAFLAGIPILHLAGGDLTFGAIDDSVRHAVTKMASLHFVNNPESGRRVMQMGEQKEKIFDVGHTAVDNLQYFKLLSRPELETELGIAFASKNILMTFHPETQAKDKGLQILKNTLTALESVKDANIFITGSNIDQGYETFEKAINDFAAAHKNARFFKSLGTQKYFSLMAQVNMVLGNSSSGLMEAPHFRVPTGRRR